MNTTIPTHTNRSRTIWRLPGVPKHLNITLKSAFIHPNHHIRAYRSYLNRNSVYKHHLLGAFGRTVLFFGLLNCIYTLTSLLRVYSCTIIIISEPTGHIWTGIVHTNTSRNFFGLLNCIYSWIFVTNIHENTQNWYSHSYKYGRLWYSRIRICVICECIFTNNEYIR